METTHAPPEVPEPGAGDGLTPHTPDQLVMGNARSAGGFRLLYPSSDLSHSGHATLIYTVEHPRDAYSKTVISARLSRRMTQHEFMSDIPDRSQKVDPPEGWAEAAWAGWVTGRVSGVQRVLRRLEPAGREHDHHKRKNPHVTDADTAEVAA